VTNFFTEKNCAQGLKSAQLEKSAQSGHPGEEILSGEDVIKF